MDMRKEFYYVWKNNPGKRKRREIKKRDNNKCMCENCSFDGQLHVHHIYPKTEFIELSFTNWNLITVCPKHHRLLHEHKNGVLGLTARGKELKKSRVKEFKLWEEKFQKKWNLWYLESLEEEQEHKNDSYDNFEKWRALKKEEHKKMFIEQEL